MDQTKTLNIYTDGGARGNPGPAALGVYIENQDKEMLAQIGKTLGIATNNVAEYNAILEGWNWVLANKDKMLSLRRINFFMDSNLAASQLNGIYKIKNANLRQLLFSIREKESESGLPAFYSHIPREQNQLADRLVNMALDNKMNLA